MKTVICHCRAAARRWSAAALFAAAQLASAAPLPAPAAKAVEGAFAQVALTERGLAPRMMKAAAETDINATAAITSEFSAAVRKIALAGDPALPQSFKDAFEALADALGAQVEAAQAAARAIAVQDQAAFQTVLPRIDAAEAAAFRAELLLLALARDSGAGASAVPAALHWQDKVAVLCGDAEMPPPFDAALIPGPDMQRRMRALAAAPAPRVPRRYAPKATPEARAVSDAIARLAAIETDLVASFAGPASRGDVASLAKLVDRAVAEMRKIPVKDCPAPFRQAFGAYGRGRVGIAAAMKDAAGGRGDPASAIADMGRRAQLQVADKSELLLQARRAGADTAPLAPVWPDAFAHLALVRLAPGASAEKTAGTPVQRYADAMAKLGKACAADCNRAPAGLAGARARAAALRTFRAKAAALDVSGLPPDVRAAHAGLLDAMQKSVNKMKSLAAGAAGNPAAFLAAVESLERDQPDLADAMEKATARLQAALRKAGADFPDDFD